MGRGTFKNHTALTSLGSNAFYNSGIRSITIPAGVTVTMKPIASLGESIKDLTVNNATSADEAAIQTVLDAVEEVLEAENIPEYEKAAFDKLTDYQKSLMDKDHKDKLEKLIDSLDDYEITKGNGKKWEKGSGQSFQFTANGPVRKFKELRIDDKVVGTSNYTIQERQHNHYLEGKLSADFVHRKAYHLGCLQ